MIVIIIAIISRIQLIMPSLTKKFLNIAYDYSCVIMSCVYRALLYVTQSGLKQVVARKCSTKSGGDVQEWDGTSQTGVEIGYRVQR